MAATVLDALKAVPGCTDARAQSVCNKLRQHLGFSDEELAHASGIFMSLDAARSQRAQLTDTEELTVQEAQKRLAATAAQTSAVLQVSPQLASARARTACRYVGYMVGPDGKPHAVVTLNQRTLITYAHGDHLHLTEGTRVEVFINNCEGDKPAPIKATVKLTSGQVDLVILEVSGQELEPPALDADVHAGEPIITVAYSSTTATSRQGHGTPAPEDQVFISVSHGSIATSAPDKHGRIRSDTPSSPGDSGGGVFSLETGKLIGMCIGREKIKGADGQYKDGFKSLLLPVTAVLVLLSS